MTFRDDRLRHVTAGWSRRRQPWWGDHPAHRSAARRTPGDHHVPLTRTTLAASTLAAVALLAGCASGSAAPAASAGGEPQTGGTLTYLEPQTWTTLYPPSAGFYPNGGIVNNITDRLLYQNPETLELEPWIATDYTVNDDATEYTFDLRTDVTYSDGTPLTAANVVKNIDLYGKGDKARALPVSEAINNYDHGEVTGDHTVVFHFTAPSPGFAQAVSTINSGLLGCDARPHERAVRPGQREGDHRQRPVRHLRRADRHEDERHGAQGLQLGAAVAAHQGAAYLAGVDYVVAAENSVRVGTVVAGQADIARNIPAPTRPSSPPAAVAARRRHQRRQQRAELPLPRAAPGRRARAPGDHRGHRPAEDRRHPLHEELPARHRRARQDGARLRRHLVVLHVRREEGGVAARRGRLEARLRRRP
jgi:hypothetical protein